MTSGPAGDGEFGEADPLDARLGRRAGPLDTLRFRAALGLDPAVAPAVVLVPIGYLLGPSGAAILPEAGVAHLHTVVSVGLAVLGIFVGFGVARGPRLRFVLAASLEAAATIAVVAGALVYLLNAWGLALDAGTALLALALGTAASASAARADESDPLAAAASRIALLDDVLPVALGAAVVAWAGGDGARPVLPVLAMTIALGGAAGLAGWLLVERVERPAERVVFVTGTVVLLGGAAAYIAVSALLAGMVAGVCWVLLPGRADEVMRDDLARLQHPLVVLLLVAAGAMVVWSRAALWLAVAFVVFRVAGKILGAKLAARAAGPLPVADLALALMPPGVLGIAFALSLFQAARTEATAAVLAAVAAGSLACEVLAVAWRPAGAARAG